jgi:hypothetical protein
MDSKKASSVIILNNINVNVVDTLSGIFIGNNNQWYWRSHNKENTGFGSISGKKNVVEKPVDVVIDPDYMDNPEFRGV